MSERGDKSGGGQTVAATHTASNALLLLVCGVCSAGIRGLMKVVWSDVGAGASFLSVLALGLWNGRARVGSRGVGC